MIKQLILSKLFVLSYILLLVNDAVVFASDEEFLLHESTQKMLDQYVALQCKVLRKENAEDQEDQSFLFRMHFL